MPNMHSIKTFSKKIYLLLLIMCRLFFLQLLGCGLQRRRHFYRNIGNSKIDSHASSVRALPTMVAVKLVVLKDIVVTVLSCDEKLILSGCFDSHALSVQCIYLHLYILFYRNLAVSLLNICLHLCFLSC